MFGRPKDKPPADVAAKDVQRQETNNDCNIHEKTCQSDLHVQDHLLHQNPE